VQRRNAPELGLSCDGAVEKESGGTVMSSECCGEDSKMYLYYSAMVYLGMYLLVCAGFLVWLESA
jgi:hypothetical protein